MSLEVLREAARKYGVPEAKVEGALEKSPSVWQRMTESGQVYVAYIQATLAEWAKSDNLVYHGNAGQDRECVVRSLCSIRSESERERGRSFNHALYALQYLTPLAQAAATLRTRGTTSLIKRWTCSRWSSSGRT